MKKKRENSAKKKEVVGQMSELWGNFNFQSTTAWSGVALLCSALEECFY